MNLPEQVWALLQQQANRSEALCRDDMVALLGRHLDSSSASVIVDCGCGDGRFTVRMAKAVNAERTIGIDVVPNNIALLEAQGIEGRVGDLDHGLPLERKSADLVVASHVIEHVTDTDMLVKECYRVLRPGGHFLIATPNLAAFLNILFLMFGRQPTIAEVSDVALVGTWSPRAGRVARTGPAHRRIFTTKALTGLLEYYGFRCKEVLQSGFLPLAGGPARLMASVLPRYASNLIVLAAKPRM
jgi:ubiquinone/menaquinone biosynthesis C-methylase UbiE